MCCVLTLFCLHSMRCQTFVIVIELCRHQLLFLMHLDFCNTLLLFPYNTVNLCKQLLKYLLLQRQFFILWLNPWCVSILSLSINPHDFNLQLLFCIIWCHFSRCAPTWIHFESVPVKLQTKCKIALLYFFVWIHCWVGTKTLKKYTVI